MQSLETTWHADLCVQFLLSHCGHFRYPWLRSSVFSCYISSNSFGEIGSSFDFENIVFFLRIYYFVVAKHYVRLQNCQFIELQYIECQLFCKFRWFELFMNILYSSFVAVKKAQKYFYKIRAGKCLNFRAIFEVLIFFLYGIRLRKSKSKCYRI